MANHRSKSSRGKPARPASHHARRKHNEGIVEWLEEMFSSTPTRSRKHAARGAKTHHKRGAAAKSRTGGRSSYASALDEGRASSKRSAHSKKRSPHASRSLTASSKTASSHRRKAASKRVRNELGQFASASSSPRSRVSARGRHHSSSRKAASSRSASSARRHGGYRAASRSR